MSMSVAKLCFNLKLFLFVGSEYQGTVLITRVTTSVVALLIDSARGGE